ncbi:MAG TPA: FAD-dependent oxidoreductase [Gaiellaceae bacterium]|jgi:NADPH-dependent 2,4-dienoyl-CoA reductase/sulfur reductase-like enzyme|nr:FAD-dependent oxidoreductase [Gaiellaceae bacterium]
MTRFELVIVGGGLAAARAIRGYRAAGGTGRVALLTRERALPYHRPPLSKRYLRGEAEREHTLVEQHAFYDEHDVELLLGGEVASLDTREQAVLTDDGRRFRYRKLLLATGAVPRALDVQGAQLAHVFTLRSLEDATAIREAAGLVRDAVVVGSGFIGMEVAASLTELGLDVTLVSRDVDLFAQLRSPEISEHLVTLYRQRGVDVIRGDEVRALRGRSRLDTVELHSGRSLAAGLAVVGVGVQPAVASVAGSGIAVDDGIVVDERFETNVPGVHAVGDVARFFDPVFARRRRIEHWSNANYQGSEVGRILAGAGGGYDTVSTFFTESFGLTLKVFGDVSQHDDRVSRGSFADGDAIVFYLDRGRLVGTLHTGQDEQTEETLKRLIRGQAGPLDVRLLADESVAVEAAFATTGARGCVAA